MRLKENFTIRKVGDEYMMISDSGSSLDYTRVISLNSTAAYLIEETKQEDFTNEVWIALLTEKYDVEEDIAKSDVDLLIKKLIKEDLIII